MGYSFKKHTFDWLSLYVSTPAVGLVLKKKYSAGVTPANQATLNVYASGKFEVSCEAAAFKQVLGVGECSLDVTVGTFPTDSIATETALETPACRICLSVTAGGKWSRGRLSVVANEEVTLTAEQIALVIPSKGWDGVGEPEVYVGIPFTVSEDSFVYKLQRES
tara:strand:+ start:462 stop:953 length:492 start_codon:yes stop_codon:yes gene_type:complete